MLDPDFNKYSLALIKDNKILFSSDKSALRPLVECVRECKFKDCTCNELEIDIPEDIINLTLSYLSGCNIDGERKELLKMGYKPEQ